MASEIKVDTIVNAGGDNDTGIDLATNDVVKVNIAGAEKARVHSDGKVGIGTNSPDYSVHVKGAASQHIAVESTNNTVIGAFTASTNDLFIGTVSNDNFIFETNGTERMKIDTSGLITSAPTASNTTGSSANMFITSGGEFAKSTSSQRYKNTINDATHGLTELLNLRSVTFKGNNDGDTIFGGLIAEEVHDAGLTEFVVYDDQNRPDALHYGSMVSFCIKAIQELKTELDNAKARITALESK